MKKTALLIILSVMTVILTACYNDGRGTYFPDRNEMKDNHLQKGYEVTTAERDGGKYLSGVKDDTYIEFYWLDDADDAEELTKKLSSEHDDYKELRSITNSDKYGNVLFCSNGKAMDDAGIQIIEVKID